MKSQRLHCDRELLRQSLQDALSEEQEEELACHLSHCAACQRELERLAGDRAEWSRVEKILQQEVQASRSDAAGPPASWQSGADSQLAPRLADGVSTADFAVEFLEPATAPGTLGRLGDIDIHEVIGRGGMGIVLRGFQRELNRPVAVKVLAPHLATSGAARQRFAREAQATAVIVHPNVMPILTVHSSGKLPHLVMPYVACESLQQRLDRDGSLPAIDVLRIAMQIASGLAAAHAQGLVHRDIKPANVLLEKGVDRAMLTDFGLARAADDASLTRTGVIAGTPQFMSPEQARGESVDARSDLFSLGSVIYAMCTGRPPFRAETSYGILRRITDTQPRPIRDLNPDIPPWLPATVDKLHEKDPAKRFHSADQLAKLLEGCLAHVQQPSAVPLPDGVQPLTLAAMQAAQRRLGFPARLRWLVSATRHPRTLPAAAILAGLVLVAAFAVLAVRGRFEDHAPGPPSASPAAEARAAPAEPDLAGERAPSARWDDGIAAEIRRLDEDARVLQRQATELWDTEIVEGE